MPYTLSEDEQLIQKVVREFATTQVGLERAHDEDRHDRFPTETLAAAAGLGLTALTIPAESGGAGVTSAAYALALYELARVDPSSAVALAVHNGLGMRALLSAPELAAKLVPKAAAGELISFLVTEEAHGSNMANLGTTAHAGKDANASYVLSGQKVWGIGAVAAKHLIVLATVPTAKDQPGGPTLFYVPSDSKGVSLGRNEPLLGLRAAGIRTVYFSNVEVPTANRVGDVGKGLEIMKAAQPWLQVGVAAIITGCVSGALAAAAEFAGTRKQFGAPIGTYQAVSDGVATMDIQAQASLALTLAAAGQLDGADAPKWGARAKAFANEMAIPMTRQAIRIQGGTGFMREGGTERFARDVRALQFVGETTQMQRDLLKRAIMPDIEYPATP